MPRRFVLGILQPEEGEYDGITGTVAMIANPEGEKEDTTNGVSNYVNNHSTTSKRPEKTRNGIILHPQPRDDPNDPLNWPTWRRDAALAVIGFHCFIGGGQSPILAAGFSTLAQQFEVSLSTLAYLVGAFMLALGFGSVMMSPIAILYGKRFAYIMGAALFFICALWAGGSHSYGSLLAARIIMGFGVSPCESLPSATIAEIYFLHERAYRLGLYTLLLLGGKNIVPLVSAFIIHNLGWNWVFWIVAIIVGFDLVMIFFFVPETWFERNPVPHDKRSQMETMSAREARARSLTSRSKTSLNASLSAYPQHSDYFDRQYHGIDEQVNHPEKSSSSDDSEKTDTGEKIAEPITPNTPMRPIPLRLQNITPGGTFKGFSSPTPSPGIASPMSPRSEATVPSPPMSPLSPMSAMSPSRRAHFSPELEANLSVASAFNPKKPFREELKIFQGKLTHDTWWKAALRPFVLFAYPAILYATFMYSLSVVWLIVMSETLSEIFKNEPYNMSSTGVGLLYVSPFVGGILGTAVAGRISDIIVRYMTRRNNGTYEPEFRLIMVATVAISVSIGLMGFGWSTQVGDLWIVPTIFFGIISFGCCLGSTTAITFAVDSYKIYAGEALVTINFTKNLLGFVFSIFTNIFLASAGSRTTFLTFGGIQLVLCVLAIPMYIYGKTARRWTDQTQLMRYLT
ncbi:major facilitator superfamily domain-containing protein [Lipomyces arxii]|uniref:major facilitator superfamily domain-containing protein n=1 Tax=Lipomyces arxii TaxID=56418 RepID=UPI0034CF920B